MDVSDRPAALVQDHVQRGVRREAEFHRDMEAAGRNNQMRGAPGLILRSPAPGAAVKKYEYRLASAPGAVDIHHFPRPGSVSHVQSAIERLFRGGGFFGLGLHIGRVVRNKRCLIVLPVELGLRVAAKNYVLGHS